MTLLYYDPIFQEHRTGDHPECAGRILPVVRHLNFVALDTSCKRLGWQAASPEQIGRVHTPDYIKSIKLFAEQGGGWIEQDTVLSEQSYEVAIMAAGAVCDAVTRIVAGTDTTAFCLVRPPGHHAMPDHAMGFCLFNNIAIGAKVARDELGIERVLIVDWDVHHGNGTQAAFWEDPSVAFMSMHRVPFYPGTGAADEVGAGPGLGTTLNLPIAFGTSRKEQLTRFRRELEQFAEKVNPQLVLISAGFDSHKDDPIGSLGLESEDFRVLTETVLRVAQRYAEGRVVSVLEGGYNPRALAECVECHLDALLAAD